MPIHIQHGNGKWHAVILELLQQRGIALLGVFPITAPPVAKGIAWHHGRSTRQTIEITDSTHVIMMIAEEIDVGGSLHSRLQPALLTKKKRLAVIKEASSAGILQTKIQRVFPVDLVKRPRGTEEIVMSRRIAVGGGTVLPAPAVVGVAVLGVYVEIFGSEFLLVIDQMKRLGGDLQPSLPVHHVEFGSWEIAVQNHLGGSVLKNTALTVFQTKKIWGQNREAIMLSPYHACGIAGSVPQIFGMLSVKILHKRVQPFL